MRKRRRAGPPAPAASASPSTAAASPSLSPPSLSRSPSHLSSESDARLTMKPGRSAERVTVLPSAAARSAARAAVSSVVSMPRTSSTRGMTWAGCIQCRPTTLPGRRVAAPRRVMEMEEVLEARMAVGEDTTPSRRAKMDRLSASSSGAASTTNSAPARASSSAARVMRPRAASASEDDRWPRLTERARERCTADVPRSRAAGEGSTRMTSRPLVAATLRGERG